MTKGGVKADYLEILYDKGYKLYVSQTGAYKGNMNQSYDTFIVGKYKGSWYIIDTE